LIWIKQSVTADFCLQQEGVAGKREWDDRNKRAGNKEAGKNAGLTGCYIELES